MIRWEQALLIQARANCCSQTGRGLTPEQIALERRLVDEGTSVREIAKMILKCHPATLYRELGRPSEQSGGRSARASG